MAGMDLSLAVAKQVEEMRKVGGYPSDEALLTLAVQIGSAFSCKKDEVAILRVSPDGRMLRFLCPVKLHKIGEIPLTSAHSLAAKDIRDKRGEIINNFAAYKHPTVFEAVDLSAEEKATPIQKIMSAPMVAEGKVLGVIEVSRKGVPGEPIGPDFTPRDLTELTAVAGILAAYITTLPYDPPTAGKKPGLPAGAGQPPKA